jgi:hypothetical protein
MISLTVVYLGHARDLSLPGVIDCIKFNRLTQQSISMDFLCNRQIPKSLSLA